MSQLPDFNRLARLYRWMEYFSFGPWLMRCRCAFLQPMLTARRALIMGDGDGRFTARLLGANSSVRVDVIDASSAMLQALVLRAIPHTDRLNTHLADARVWKPDDPHAHSFENQPFDLVVTHFFLDCLTTEEIAALASTLRPAIAPSAQWVVSEFAISEGWYGRWVARPLIWGLYRAFGWLTGLELRRLPEHHAGLRLAGFSLQRQRAWLGGLLVSELWSASRADSAQI